MRRLVVAAVVVALAAGLGCKKREAAVSADPAMPPPINAAQARQVRDACAAYVERLCRCAAESPADAARQEECTLARAIPEALELAIRGAEGPHQTRVNAEGALANVGKIQKNCVESLAQLATTCPR